MAISGDLDFTLRNMRLKLGRILVFAVAMQAAASTW
jgi:hypothetical protein